MHKAVELRIRWRKWILLQGVFAKVKNLVNSITSLGRDLGWFNDESGVGINMGLILEMWGIMIITIWQNWWIQ